jgi:large subunit ribosomal protein L21
MTDQETTTTAEPVEAPVVAATAEPEIAAPKGYAIIETGGKQYRVKVGDRISVERLPDDAGGDITFDRVLLLGGDGSTRIGTPVVDGASVSARVDDHFRGEKLIVFKYKAKKRYRRRIGHRQELTHLTITGIAG